MRDIKFRQWNSIKNRYQYDIGETGPGSWSGPAYCTWETYPLEQYTGLKDKNGRECYEGDIISRSKSESRIGVIQFAQGAFGINWDYATNSDPEWIDGTMYGSWGSLSNLRDINDGFITRCLEVIGNIHEDAALLGHTPGPSAV